MSRIAFLVVMTAALAAAGCASTASSNVGPAGPKSERASVVEQDTLAASLLAWGREHQHAGAVALAGRMMTGDEGKSPLEAEHSEAALGGDERAAEPKPEAAPATKESIAQEAEGMVQGDARMLDAVRAMRTMGVATRGVFGGAKWDDERIPARTKVTYTATFRGRELAVVGVIGDHTTDLDLYIYDQNGNLIASDTDATDVCLVSWTPDWTGTFHMEVHNLGYVWNDMRIETN